MYSEESCFAGALQRTSLLLRRTVYYSDTKGKTQRGKVTAVKYAVQRGPATPVPVVLVINGEDVEEEYVARTRSGLNRRKT